MMNRKDDDIQIIITPEVQERLLNVMQTKEMTKYQLAKQINCAFSTITNYCSGNISNPNPGKIDAICKVLGISKFWLATGKDKVSDAGIGEATTTPATVERLQEDVKQVLIKLNADDHQYQNLHSDMNYARKDLAEIRIALKKMTDLQTELVKLIKQAIENK